MKFRQIFLSVAVTCLPFSAAVLGEESDSETRLVEARGLVQQMSGKLKPALMEAMAQGGPESAVEICAEKAPQIAADLSQDGWLVKRVSVKNRNPEAAPDAWERKVLARFETKMLHGASADALVFAEQTADGYRFAKAQVTESLCLSCHGTNLAPGLEAKIKELYPEDKATGYQLGQIRGMFSLTYKP